MNCVNAAGDSTGAVTSKRSSKGHTRQNSSSGGGGILSFLKTEIDSFVKGLSGHGEKPVATTSSHDPPKKRQKRSHEPEGRPSYDSELDAIRQHTAHRYSAQDYVPLTAANLRASTSRVQIEDYDDAAGLPTRSSLSQSTGRDVRSSNKPLPRLEAQTSSPARQPSSTTIDARSPDNVQEQRRRKRERAATFVNDEEARRVLLHQIKEQEEREAEYARLAEEEARRQRRKEKERHAREQKRKLERADALARLEAQQRLEEEQDKEEQDRLEQERLRVKEEDARRNRQRERKKLEEGRRLRAIEEENMRQERIQEEEEQKAKLRQQQEDRAAERERKRVRELEAEVERLKRELEAAKQSNRHVHFAPTPPDSERSGPALSLHPDASFLSMSSTGSFVEVAHPPPPPPTAPPPPPLANSSTKANPMAIIAARKAALKSTPPRKKIPTNGIGVAMPVDMGKFLNEMKNTKLKKVGLPTEGKKEKKEESGLKGVLEHVLRKQFKPDDRTSSSTRSTQSTFPSFPSRSSRENLSASTSSSITSFSSYRPLDWSFELDNAPIPPPRPHTALERRASLKHTPLHQSTNSTSSLPVPPRPVLPSAIKASRTLSHPQATSTPKKSASQPDLRNSLDRQPVQSTSSQQLQRTQIRPQAAFGHALTSEEPQQAGRTKAQPYGHRRQNSNSLASSLASSSATTVQRHYDLPRPSLRETMDVHGSTRSIRTAGQSIRSAGSSFDVDIYAQMQLKEDDDELEEETRRSLSNPPRIDGMMDLPSPTFSLSFLNPPQPQARKVSTSKIPRSDSLNAMQSEVEAVAYPANRQALRKVSDFTHPRRAPAPPQEDYIGKHDSLGRPVSPAKAKARQRAEQSRYIPSLHEDDEIFLRGAGLTDEDANRLLQDDEGDGSILVGYGRR